MSIEPHDPFLCRGGSIEGLLPSDRHMNSRSINAIVAMVAMAMLHKPVAKEAANHPYVQSGPVLSSKSTNTPSAGLADTPAFACVPLPTAVNSNIFTTAPTTSPTSNSPRKALFNRRTTPQSQPIPGSTQVPNLAGGYSWAADDWIRFDRFLVLGAEGGTYYIAERDLVKQNHDALNASQCQVVEIVAAAMNPRDDVLDVKCGQRRIFLSQLAILAPISGAFPHLSSERRAHPLRFGPSHLPRLPLKDGDEFVRPDVAFVLGPFLLGELTFGRFGGDIIDPSLKLRVRPIIQDGFGFVRQNDSQNGANPPVERSAFWCRYHSRTIANTIRFRKRKKPLCASVNLFTRRDERPLRSSLSPTGRGVLTQIRVLSSETAIFA